MTTCSPDITLLSKKYSAPTPRYTSYPTAPLFNTEFCEADYRQHAERSNAGLIPKNLSVYVHVPFCHSMCYFCGCNKVITRPNHDKVEKYLEALLEEISLRSQLFGSDRLVTQIHFGGGTPNFLSGTQLAMILDQIASHLHLDLPKNIEISIEIDPRTVTVDDIRELSSVGFNRFSVGVQDFCHSVQKAINRVQDYDHTLAIINECKRVSDSVNVDLVTGLPNQSTDTFSETLTTIAEHKVDRVAVYNFAFLPNKIPAQKMIQPSTLPNLDERLRLTDLVNESLGQSGYQHIGMDHFALEEDSLSRAWRDDTLHRNFMGYTTKRDTDLIGFGASAISKFDSAYAQNHTSLRDYVDEIEREQLPIAKGISLNEDDRIRAAVIQQVMCRQAVNLQQPISRLSGRPTNQTLSEYFAPELEALTSFCEDGLIEIGKTEFRLTEAGRHFMRPIAALFDAYLENGPSNSVVEFSRTA